MAVEFKRKTAITKDGYLDKTFSDLSDGQNTNVFVSGGNRRRMGLWNMSLSGRPTFGNSVLKGASLNVYCTSAETPENETLGDGSGTGTEDGHVLKLYKLKSNKTLTEGSTTIANMDILAYSASQFDSNAILFEEFSGSSFYNEPEIKVSMNETYKLKESGPYITVDEFKDNQKGAFAGRNQSREDIYRNYAFKPFQAGANIPEGTPWVAAAAEHVRVGALRGLDRVGLPNFANHWSKKNPTVTGNEQVPLQKGSPFGVSNIIEQGHHHASRASNYVKSGTNYWKKKIFGGGDVVKTKPNHAPKQLWKPKYGHQLLQDDIYVMEDDVDIKYEASDTFETVPLDIPLLQEPPEEVWVTEDNCLFSHIRKAQNVKFLVEGATEADKNNVDIAQSNFVYTQRDSTQAALMENIHAYFENDGTQEGHIQSADGQDLLQEVRAQCFVPAPLHLDSVNALRYEESPFIDIDLRIDIPIAYTPLTASDTAYTDPASHVDGHRWSTARALWLMFNRYPIGKGTDICKWWTKNDARDCGYGLAIVKMAAGQSTDAALEHHKSSGKLYALINAHDLTYTGVDETDFANLPYVEYYNGAPDTPPSPSSNIMGYIRVEDVKDDFAKFRFWCTSDGIKLGIYKQNEEGEYESIIYSPSEIDTTTQLIPLESKHLQYVSITGNVNSNVWGNQNSDNNDSDSHNINDHREWSAARKYHIKSDKAGTYNTGSDSSANRAKSNHWSSKNSPSGGWDHDAEGGIDGTTGSTCGLQYMWAPWFTVALTNIRADGERTGYASSNSGFGTQEQWRHHLIDSDNKIQDTISRVWIDSFGAFRFNYIHQNASINSGNLVKGKLVARERVGHNYLPLSPYLQDVQSATDDLSGWDSNANHQGAPGMGYYPQDSSYFCFGFKNKSDFEGATKYFLMHGFNTVPQNAATSNAQNGREAFWYSSDMHPLGEFWISGASKDSSFPFNQTGRLTGVYGNNADSIPVTPFPRLRSKVGYDRGGTKSAANFGSLSTKSYGFPVWGGLSTYDSTAGNDGTDVIITSNDVTGDRPNWIDKWSQSGFFKVTFDEYSDSDMGNFLFMNGTGASSESTPNTDSSDIAPVDYFWRPETTNNGADITTAGSSWGFLQKDKVALTTISNCSTVSGSSSITWTNGINATVKEGMAVSGTGIAAGSRVKRLTQVAASSTSTAILNKAATSSGGTRTMTFGSSLPNYVGPNLNAAVKFKDDSTAAGGSTAYRGQKANIRGVDTNGFIYSNLTAALGGGFSSSKDGNQFTIFDGPFVKRENPLVQARITKVIPSTDKNDSTNNYYDIEVDDASVITNAEDEVYMLYHASREWVPTWSSGQDYSSDAQDIQRQNRYCVTLVTVENHGSFFRIKDADEYATTNKINVDISGGAGTKMLKEIIFNANEDGTSEGPRQGWDDHAIPRGRFLNADLCISPYRYWITARIPLKDYKRTYDAICEVTSTVDSDFSDAAGTTNCALQSTYNESQFTDSNRYTKAWNFDKSTEGEIELDTDFGYGSFNDETLEGGYAAKATMLTGAYNEFIIDGVVLSGAVSESDALTVVALPNDETDNMIMRLDSSEGTNTPFLTTTFIDERPLPPANFKVYPNEQSPFYPEYSWESSDEDLWYGFMLIDYEPILHQYHKASLHIPMNEETIVDGSTSVKYYRPDQGIHYKAISDSTKLETQSGYATVTGVTTNIEGLAGNNLNFDGTNDFLLVTNESYTKPTTEMSILLHVIPDAKPSATSGTRDRGTVLIDKAYEYKIWIDDNAQVNAKVWPNTGSTPDADDIPVEVKSASAVLYDTYTPTCIILTVDTKAKYGNVKLYINGKLEDQSGLLKTTASANNWKKDADIEDFSGTYNDLYIGVANATTVQTGTYFDGKMEELVIYNYLINPVIPSDQNYVHKKPEKELTTASEAASLTTSARLFVKDYHNIRGVSEHDVSCSPILTHRKAAFRLRTN